MTKTAASITHLDELITSSRMRRSWAMTHKTLRCTPNARRKSQSCRTWSRGGVQAQSVSTAVLTTLVRHLTKPEEIWNSHGNAYISADKFLDRRYANNSESTIFKQRSSSCGILGHCCTRKKRLPSGHCGRLLMLVGHITGKIVRWTLRSRRMLLALKAWCTGKERQGHSFLGHM